MDLRRIAAWALTALPCFAFSVLPAGAALPVRVYTSEDGLAGDSVGCVLADSRGFLWFGTNLGLSRFDGRGFTNFGVAQGFEATWVGEILEDADGSLWLATNWGVDRFDPKNGGRFEHIARDPEGVERWNVAGLVRDREGRLWCGSSLGVFRLESEGGRAIFRSVQSGVYAGGAGAMTVDREGGLWVEAVDGVYRRSREGTSFALALKVPGAANQIFCDSRGRIWRAARWGLFLVEKDPSRAGRWMQTPVAVRGDRGNDQWWNGIAEDAQGALWAVASKGVYSLLPGAESFAPASLFRSSRLGELLTIRIDVVGRLWVGTEAGGVARFDPRGMAVWTAPDDIPDERIASVLGTQEDDLLVTNGHELVYRLGEDGFHVIRPRLPAHITRYSWGWGQIHLQDHLGEWWIPTGQGLCRFPAVRAEELEHVQPKNVYTTRDGLGNDDVFRLFEDARGDLWIATGGDPRRALVRWERTTGRMQRFGPLPGHTQGYGPSAFAEDRSGNLWIGCYGGGIARFARGAFTPMPPLERAETALVAAFHLDHEGRLWVATTRGLFRIDDPASDRPRTTRYGSAEGLASESVSCILEDRWGRLYLGLDQGLDRMDPRTGAIRHYSREDGLPNLHVICAFADPRGDLWFGTLSGLFRLTPHAEEPKEPPPPLIFGLQLAGIPRPLSAMGEREIAGLTLGASERQIQVDFQAPEVATAGPLRYQYRLDGAEHGWSSPTTQRSLLLEGLSSGGHRLELRSLSADGVPANTAAVLSFRVLPPFWRSGWFLALSIAGVLAAVYGIHRVRVSRVVALERARTRIATDLHDDLGTSLARIAILSDVGRRELERAGGKAAERMDQIGDTARSLVDRASDIVWSIDPRHDDLRSVLARLGRYAGDTLESQGIVWTLSAPSDSESIALPLERRGHLFLVLKEALANAAKHSGASRVELLLRVEDGMLRAEVTDDGRGFASDSAPTSLGGNGLENMRSRTRQAGGQLDIVSTPGAGTRVTVRMPLR